MRIYKGWLTPTITQTRKGILDLKCGVKIDLDVVQQRFRFRFKVHESSKYKTQVNLTVLHGEQSMVEFLTDYVILQKDDIAD